MRAEEQQPKPKPTTDQPPKPVLEPAGGDIILK